MTGIDPVGGIRWHQFIANDLALIEKFREPDDEPIRLLDQGEEKRATKDADGVSRVTLQNSPFSKIQFATSTCRKFL